MKTNYEAILPSMTKYNIQYQWMFNQYHVFERNTLKTKNILKQNVKVQRDMVKRKKLESVMGFYGSN